MYSIATKNGGKTAVKDGSAPQNDALECCSGEIRERLQQIAQEVMSDISSLDPAHSRELLGVFVTELFFSVAEQEQRERRRQRQTEAIAAAKERGVRFGRGRLALPEGFEDMVQRWDEGDISAGEAARCLGMSSRTFVRRAKEHCAV